MRRRRTATLPLLLEAASQWTARNEYTPAGTTAAEVLGLQKCKTSRLAAIE